MTRDSLADALSGARMTATRIDPVRLGMWIALVATVVCGWSAVLWVAS